MNELAPRLTENGKYYIIEAMNGDGITFTKIVLGNGTNDSTSPTALVSPQLEVGITDIKTQDNCAILSGTFNNANVANGFYMKELGVYAKNVNNEEILYAYRYLAEGVDYIPSSTSGDIIESVMTIVVAVGDAENVDAVIIEGEMYATKEDLTAHIKDQTNPHKVTKEQVGLGNVPNVTTNYQTPTYTVPNTLSRLVSGEALSIAFGKLAAGIQTLISHLDNRTLHITSAERSAWNSKASGTHTHAASDIASGTLPIARGGTGVTTMHALQSNLKIPGVYVTYVMQATNWANDTYSFEKDYARTKYNLEVGLAPTATDEQRAVFAMACIVGAHDRNIVKALGAIPSIDIPVILKAMEVI